MSQLTEDALGWGVDEAERRHDLDESLESKDYDLGEGDPLIRYLGSRLRYYIYISIFSVAKRA